MTERRALGIGDEVEMRDSIRGPLAPARLLAMVFGLGLAISACNEGDDGVSAPTCPEGCGPNMICQSDGSCACASDFRDCDGKPSNGCEHQGNTCDGPCVGEDDAAFCSRLNKTCGDVTGKDNCDVARTATCGSCPDGKTCGADNTCSCKPESDAAFCSRLGKNCGDVIGTDNCNIARSATCGSCPDGQTCGDDKTCSCKAEDDAAFCARLGKNCGEVTDKDNCGTARTATCGTCPTGQTCGDDNTCACIPEDDATFCSRQSKECGSFAGSDNCGKSRTVDCGTCEGNATCGAPVPNICGPCVGETDAQLCTKANATCGQLHTTDRCGDPRIVADCGACADGTSCLADNSCGEPDGVWLHDTCFRRGNTIVLCATNLTCIRTYTGGVTNWEGVCKQACESDADCTTGGSCASVGKTDGQKFCGTPRSPGDACSSWRGSADVCHDPSRAEETFLECLGGTCSYVCDYDGNLGAPPYDCPAGQSCGDGRVRDPQTNFNLHLCE